MYEYIKLNFNDVQNIQVIKKYHNMISFCRLSNWFLQTQALGYPGGFQFQSV